MKKIISKIISRLHLDTFKEISMIRLGMRKKIFEQNTLRISKLYKNILKPGMLVFDIGANRGHYTSGFLTLGAEVVSVEPQKDCFKILKTRYKNNNRVHLLNFALDYEKGEKKMYISNLNTVSSMSEDWISAVKSSNRFPNAQWNKSDMVKTTTLDALLNLYGTPDFIKIDVEGYELNVLKGLTHKVPLISIEYTFETIENTALCLDYLETIGKILILPDGTIGFDNDVTWISTFEFLTIIRRGKRDATGDIFIKFVE